MHVKGTKKVQAQGLLLLVISHGGWTNTENSILCSATT